MTDAAALIPNVTDPNRWCRWCGNDGWVELRGTVTAHRVTYSRGMAPCKSCEAGRRRYLAATGEERTSTRHHHRRWTPESRFTEADVEPVDPRIAAERIGRNAAPPLRIVKGLDP